MGRTSTVFKQIGWVTFGLSMAAVGVLLSREIRDRWSFAHRSPYDFYGHSEDEFQGAEAGVGV